MIFLYVLGLLAIFAILYFVSEYLEESFQTIAYRFKMPASLAGATLLAVSSSLPEFFTSFNGALIYNTLEIGFMTIIWSAIFNILVITGVVGISSSKPLPVSRNVITRDMIIYLGAMIVLVVLLLDGELTFFDSYVLTAVYFLYIVVLYLQRKSMQEGEELEPAHASKLKIGISLSGGIAAIGVLSAGMVYLGSELATSLGISIAVISALVFSTGTSVPDMLLSYFSAKRGVGSAAISNIFGSNTFDITMCLSLPALLVLYRGERILGDMASLRISLFMLFASILLTSVLIAYKFEVTKTKGWITLATFVSFVAGFLYSLN